jgi:hypothetical protein
MSVSHLEGENMRRLLILLCALTLILAACDSGGSGGGNPGENSGPVQWDRSPTTVVFRAEVRGGQYEGTFLSRNEIPPCTIYGDNRVVWTAEVGGGNVQVLFDQVADESIVAFVNYMAINQQFYSYTSGLDTAPPSSVSPVVETLTLFVNDVNKRTDAMGGWGIDYYERAIESCANVSTEPAVFEPDGGWISAEEVAYDSQAPLLVWDANASGLNFSELAASGQPRWITGDLVRVLWNMLRTSVYGVRFDQGDFQYHVALQVPGITRDAPAAP